MNARSRFRTPFQERRKKVSETNPEVTVGPRPAPSTSDLPKREPSSSKPSSKPGSNSAPLESMPTACPHSSQHVVNTSKGPSLAETSSDPSSQPSRPPQSDQSGQPDHPDQIKLSDMVRLRSVNSGASRLHMTVRGFVALLDRLNIPLVAIGPKRYYNEDMLELGIYMLTFFRSPGLAFPGSEDRLKGSRSSLPRDAPPDFPSSEVIKEAVSTLVRVYRGKAQAAATRARALATNKPTSRPQSRSSS